MVIIVRWNHSLTPVQQRIDAARGPKQRGEHQPSKPLSWREKLSRPRSPASTPRFDVPPEQPSWSLNMSWLPFNARFIRPVGLHPAAQVRHVHSIEKRRPHSDSNSSLLPRGATRPTEPATLPPACKQRGCPAVPLSHKVDRQFLVNVRPLRLDVEA